MKGGKMSCNCSLTEKIVGILVIVFAWWSTGYNEYILTIIGLVLIWHAFRCTNCNLPATNMPKKPVTKAVKKKK
tara:strand:- start:181 stop:402 length:222 start_codon:yes stop_codon:yes gene_type:complete